MVLHRSPFIGGRKTAITKVPTIIVVEQRNGFSGGSINTASGVFVTARSGTDAEPQRTPYRSLIVGKLKIRYMLTTVRGFEKICTNMSEILLNKITLHSQTKDVHTVIIVLFN